MERYVVLTNDIDHIERDRLAFLDLCRIFFGWELSHYLPMTYHFHSGYWRTVEEEAAFIIGCQELPDNNREGKTEQRLVIDNVEEFLRRWELTDYRDYNIDHLSGGWRKFLSLALFANIRHPGAVFFDLGRQLSARLIRLFVCNIAEVGACDVALFVEYDTQRLIEAFDDFTPIYDLGDRFSFEPWALPNDGRPLGNNYVRT